MSPFQGPFLSLSHSTSVNIRLNWGQESVYQARDTLEESDPVPFHPSPELGDSRVILPEGKRGRPGGEEGLATLEGEAVASPRRGGVRVPSQGAHSRSRNAGRGSDMAGRARRLLRMLWPRQDRERDGAARTSPTPPWSDRPKAVVRQAPRPASLPPAAAPCGPSRDAEPAVGRLAARSGVRAGSERAGRRALTIVSAAPSRPPHFTPLRSGELPAPEPRHVTLGLPPHVTPPFLSSLPPAPVSSGSLAPPYWPARPGEERLFGGGALCSTTQRRGRSH